jgi:M6 family metalloprotease-like protein
LTLLEPPNTPGSFTCACDAGYAGDGRSCYAKQPTLHGLCVVADFLDSTLEDWTGPGFNTIDEIEAQIEQMSEHWLWMSAGTQEFTWDKVIRVQLPVTLEPNAYAGWPEFRTAAVERARAQLGADLADYDGDGILDSVWIIAANGDRSDCAFLPGGASQNAGARVFVDWQSGNAAQGGATGCFSHEVGHNRGLPDIYGRYDTLGFLSLMSESWTLPPHGFSALDRLWLGWLEPTEVAGSETITLPPAETHLEAVRIPGVEPFEYLLHQHRGTECRRGRLLAATGLGPDRRRILRAARLDQGRGHRRVGSTGCLVGSRPVDVQPGPLLSKSGHGLVRLEALRPGVHSTDRIDRHRLPTREQRKPGDGQGLVRRPGPPEACGRSHHG